MKILIASPLCPQSLEYLRKHHDVRCAFDADPPDLPSLVEDREAIIFRSGVQITAAVMSRAPDLRLLVRAGSGLDNIDLDYLREKGLTLVRVPQPGAQAVAELALGQMLALARQILPADRMLRQGHWAKHELRGYLLTGKTLGIVGAGNIGSRLGELGVALGMQAIGCVGSPRPDTSDRLNQQGIRLTGFQDVLRTADFVSVHVPLCDATRNLIDAEALSLMKSGAFLVNLARGGVVNEAALYDALTRDGGLAGAGLDVHQREGEGQISALASLPHVVLTPHIGSTTIDTQREIGRRIIEILNGQ